jgi:microsomal epoxide hydrolase
MTTSETDRKPFSTLPPAASSNIKTFTISFPQSELQHLKDLLKLTPIPSPSYENSLPDSDRRLGLRRDWLASAKSYWENDFDWREAESRLNDFPHYQATVEDELGAFNLHFVALFSEKPDAIPILMLHGWPGSFIEFIGILDLLRNQYTPETLPYHVIIPSLPGYTFSTLPSTPHIDFSQIDCARIFDSLATSVLGFKSYVVQGGDVGSRVARCMGVNHPHCAAVHLNFCGISQPVDDQVKGAISDTEKAGIERWEEWKATGTAYAMEHATRPATIGAVLASNPVALLAWMSEKFLDWTDQDPSLHTIVEAVTLYWLTKSTHTNLWSYRHVSPFSALLCPTLPRSAVNPLSRFCSDIRLKDAFLQTVLRPWSQTARPPGILPDEAVRVQLLPPGTDPHPGRVGGHDGQYGV